MHRESLPARCFRAFCRLRFAAWTRIAAALLLATCTQLDAAGALSGRRAPGFSLPDSSMKQHDPQDYRGKVLLVDFMQTKCPSCKTVTGVLEQLKAKYGDKLQVLSVVIMPDSMDNVREYITANSVSSPILFDCGQVAASYLKVTPQNPTIKFPHVFVIDPAGRIANDFGHDDAEKGSISVKTLSGEIEKLLPGATDRKR